MEIKLHRRKSGIFEMTQIGAAIRLCFYSVLVCLLPCLGLTQVVSDLQQPEPPAPVLKKVGSWPGYGRGPALDVALFDSYAYVAIGFGGILILDVSNPATPKRVGYVDDVGYASLLKTHNGRLYVASKIHRGNRYGKEGYRGKLLILDLADPVNPLLLGTHILGTEIQSFDLHDTRILIGEGNHEWGHSEASLRLLEVNDPGSIRSLDVLQLRNNDKYHRLSSPGMVFLNQNRSYVSGFQASFDRVLVNQVSESGKQSPLYTIFPKNNHFLHAHHVQVHDNLVFICGRISNGSQNALQIWDTISPAAPQLKGSVDIFGKFSILNDFPEMEIKDGKAILCTKQFGIEIVQISDPANPSMIGQIDTPGTAMRAEIDDNIIYVADFEGGLQIVELHDSGNLQSIGHFDTGLTPNTFHVAGNRGFLLNQSKEQFLPNRPSYRWFIPGNIECIDLSDPTKPILLGKLDQSHFVEFFTPTETHLFIGYIDKGIAKVKIFDVTDPLSPEMLSETVLTQDGNETISVEMMATHFPPRLYVSEKASRKRNTRVNLTTIFDTTNPTKLERIESFTRGGAVRGGMKLHQNLLIQNAATSNSEDALLVIDIHSQDDYRMVGSFGMPSREWSLLGRKRGGLDATNRYVYSGLSWNGFSIADIAQPDDPEHLFHQLTDGEVQDLAVNDERLYVAEGWRGFTVYDVADPLSAHQVASIPTRGPATHIETANDHAFVVNQANGLEIFELIPESLSITTQPKSARAVKGEQVTLRVDAIGSGKLSYQWFQGESGDTSHPIVNARNPSFTTLPNEKEEHYWVQINDEKNQLASETAQVSPIHSVSVELIGRWPNDKEPSGRQGSASDIAIWGDLAYMADGIDGIQILHIADPTNPIKMANYSVWAKQLKIHGNDLYLSSNTFRIYSIQNPYEPRETYKSRYDGLAMLPLGSWGYVSTDAGFFNLNKKNLTSTPTLLKSRLISSVSEWHSKDITISNNIVAVSQNWGGIQLMDVTHPDEPAFVSAYYPNASINQIAWKNTTIVATHGAFYPGLETVDMSDPLRPKQMASINLPRSKDVAIMDGSYACVTGKGLQVFDYGDPTQLVRVGESELRDVNTHGIVIEGNLAYVAAGRDGLLIFKITPEIELAPPFIENGQLKLSWLGAPDIVLQSKILETVDDWKDIPATANERNWMVDVNSKNQWFRLIKK